MSSVSSMYVKKCQTNAMDQSSIYLGILLIPGRKKTKGFGRMKDKLLQRLEGWRSQLLSRAGKTTIIKSVMQSIPLHTLFTFRVPNVETQLHVTTCHCLLKSTLMVALILCITSLSLVMLCLTSYTSPICL